MIYSKISYLPLFLTECWKKPVWNFLFVDSLYFINLVS
ncbi:hypothetical protein CPter91_1933 [Collimonas pratensis]|uniref:Uncharacterized protein n=1 Tax=Collimonas pratensis TaxID=279113 RepID=A0A127Q3A6_9BURK|nr:hypothetical protein CPter91_1933 [Collimonas pratensis]